MAGDGTVYFLSPELLAGAGNGTANQPNLFVVRPGSAPRFVATIDSSVGKAPPPPPKHPVVNAALVSGLSNPESLAVDQSTGDLYVSERGNSSVDRYTSAGAADNFTEGPNSGSNKLTGQPNCCEAENQIAFDNAAASPLKNSLYVTNNSNAVLVYAGTGKQLGEITGFGEACGVAVNQATGDVYVGDYGAAKIWRFAPTSGGPAVTNANYTITSIQTEPGFNPCQVAADTAGNVYASRYSSGPLRVYEAADFAPGSPIKEGTEVSVAGSIPPSTALYTDPVSNELFVDTGSRIVVLDSNQKLLKEFGSGDVSSFGGVAVNGTSKHAYAVNGSNIVEFGIEADAYEPIDDPAVVHAVNDNEVHRWSDFQTTADGRFALFSSKQPLSRKLRQRRLPHGLPL